MANKLLVTLKYDASDHEVGSIAMLANNFNSLAEIIVSDERSQFAFNCLCILGRNLQKSPEWTDAVDPASLVALSIKCLMDCRQTTAPDRSKILACSFQIHRFAVKKKVTANLVFDLSKSIFNFETDDFTIQYQKTYWAIFVDKLNYIEVLKANKQPIEKLIRTLSSDIEKLIKLYTSLKFTKENLTLLVKKLYFLYSDSNSKELNDLYSLIFDGLSRDRKLKEACKRFSDTEFFEFFKCLNESLLVVLENSSKVKFEQCPFKNAIHFMLLSFSSNTALYHCIKMLYSNIFGDLIDKLDGNLELLITECSNSMDFIEKLGYTEAAIESYPYLAQYLRVFLEFAIRNTSGEQFLTLFDIDTVISCINLILKLISKLNNARQTSKCEQCPVKTSAHDIIRLSFTINLLVKQYLMCDIKVERLQAFYIEFIEVQTRIIGRLEELKCTNSTKYQAKLLTDVHNLAITLYKSKIYEFSITLFDVYIISEARNKNSDQPSISRALYNKAICLLDYCLFERALLSCYLSLALSKCYKSERDKHMSLVIDIKSKCLKENTLNVQSISVVEACSLGIGKPEYREIRGLLDGVDFCEYLDHELDSYFRLWPSCGPVIGVLKSYLWLMSPKRMPDLNLDVDQNRVTKALCSAVVDTVFNVRSIAELTDIIQELLAILEDEDCCNGLEISLYRTSVRMLHVELAIQTIRSKNQWRCPSPTKDGTDTMLVSQTLYHEFEAVKLYAEVLRLWRDLLQRFRIASQREQSCVTALSVKCLNLALLSTHVLDNFCQTTLALEFADVCLQICHIIRKSELYLTFLSIILSHCQRRVPAVDVYVNEIAPTHLSICMSTHLNVALKYICRVSLYHHVCGEVLTAYKLCRYVQLYHMKCPELSDSDVHLALLECQTGLHRSAPMECRHNILYRRCIQHMRTNTGAQTGWFKRQLSVLTCQLDKCIDSVMSDVRTYNYARARITAESAKKYMPAHKTAEVLVQLSWADINSEQNASTHIESIKQILDSKERNYIESRSENLKKPEEVQRGHELMESVLDSTVFQMKPKNPSSPSCPIAGFKLPEFLYHENCLCYACSDYRYMLLAFRVVVLEASMYFRSQQRELAVNYFKGALRFSKLIEGRVKGAFSSNVGYINDICVDYSLDRLVRTRIELYSEYGYYCMSVGDYEKASVYGDSLQLELNKLIKTDCYMENFLLNYQCCLEYLIMRRTRKQSKLKQRERDADSLCLTPDRNIGIPSPKTPEDGPMHPPKYVKPKIQFNPDDLPEYNRKIKIDWSNKSPKPAETNDSFKLPVLNVRKAETEIIPDNKCGVLISITDVTKCESKVSLPESVPVFESEDEIFGTPLSTPMHDVFFTPMTVKTYTRKAKPKFTNFGDTPNKNTADTKLFSNLPNIDSAQTSCENSPDTNITAIDKNEMSLDKHSSIDLAKNSSGYESYLVKNLNKIKINAKSKSKLPKCPNDSLEKAEKKPIARKHSTESKIPSISCKDDLDRTITLSDKNTRSCITRKPKDTSASNKITRKLNTNDKVIKTAEKFVKPSSSNEKTLSLNQKTRKKSNTIDKPTKNDDPIPKCDLKSSPGDKVLVKSSSDNLKTKSTDEVCSDTQISSKKSNIPKKESLRVRTLKRATSPGKLDDVGKSNPVRTTRSSRLRLEKLKLSPDVESQEKLKLFLRKK